MSAKCTMGVDVGTTGCKAVVFDDAGAVKASAYREYPVLNTEDNGAELDSNLVMNQCLAVIAEAAGRMPGIVNAIGISSQGEAFTAVDSSGEHLCNGMVSSDVRSDRFARDWPRGFGENRLYGITGHTAHPMHTLFKLLWLKEHRSDVWRRAAKFLCFEDLLEQRLGVDPAMGWPLAGRTMLFDVRRHEWSPEILGAIGLDAGRLARPLPAGTVAGTIPHALADELKLARGARVVTGGHDQPCGALGAGVTEPGVAMYATGTVECITPAFATAIFTDALRAANLCTYDHTVPGMYTTVAFSLTGGNLLKWFRDEFGAEERSEAARTGRNVYELILERAGRDPSKLLVLPYFTPSGTPHFDLATKGAILGLRLSTTRGEILRALLEGVAFEMRLNLEILEQSGCAISELRAIGGGARSAFWTQLKADVLGKPITVLDVTEAGCLGAAMLARAAETSEPVQDLAGRWVRTVSRVEPRADAAREYSRRFETYRAMYATLKNLPI